MRINNSIKKKIVLTFCLILASSLIVSGGVAYYYCSNILLTQSLKDEMIKLNRTARQLEYITDDIQKFSLNIILDNNVQSYLKSGNENYIEMVSTKQKILDQISQLEVQRDYVLNIVLMKDQDMIFSKAQFGIYLDIEYYRNRLKEPWYINSLKNKNNAYFGMTYDLPIKTGKVEAIPYIINIKDSGTPKEAIGQMIVNINYDYFKKFMISDSEENDDYFWISSRNELLFQKNPKDEKIGRSEVNHLINTTKAGMINSIKTANGYLVIDKTMKNGWVLASYVFSNRITKKTQYIIYFFLLYTVIIILLTIIVMMPIVFGITKPLSKLTKAMKQVSDGDMETYLAVKGEDELSVLANGFNKMLVNLKEYVNKSIEDEKEKKRIEFMILLAQINPHFIYNTLHTVIYMASKTHNEEIVDMVRSFITILQDGVKINQEGLVTPLGQEIEVVRQYVNIQKYRYRDRFDIVWNIEEELLLQKVPRTILQPIVENSLLHGLLLTDKKGIIRVEAFSQLENIIITIEDNGIGMEKDTIHRILNGLEDSKQPNKMRSIGLSNVLERIKYLCGEQYGMDIKSEQGTFTRFIITLPKDLS